MTATELLQALRARGIRLTADGEHLRVNAPKGSLTQDLQLAIKEHKGELLEFLRGLGSGGPEPGIQAGNREGHLPLSSFQERLWVLDRLDPNSNAYHLVAWQTWDLSFEAEAASGSLTDLVSRHEILRTNFETQDGTPGLVIHPPQPADFALVDWREESIGDLDARLSELAAEESRRPMDLAEGELFRPVVVCIGPTKFAVVMTVHHIITDAWSLGLILAEWRHHYEAHLAGSPDPAGPPSLQYADFSAWQRDFLKTEEVQGQEAFWREYLLDAPTVLTLPSDRPRGPTQAFDGGVLIFGADAETSQKVRELCISQGVTPFMVWLATFSVLLGRYSGQRDILIGSPAAARNSPALESMLGPFVNTMVFRVQHDPGDTVEALLARTRESVLGAHAHQAVPFERLVEIIPAQRTMAHPPLFQVSCAYHNQPGRSEFSVSTGGSMFELTLNGFEIGEELAGSIEFSHALFDEPTIQLMAGHFRTLLRGLADDPTALVDELSMLPPEELDVVLKQWSRGPRSETTDWVVGAFETRAQEAPGATAIRVGDEALTYSDLNRRVEDLVRLLHSRGLERGDTVAIVLPRTADLVAAPLAVMKAGGVYVPLDPEYPRARLKYILDDSGSRFVLSDGSSSHGIGDGPAEMILLESENLSSGPGEDAAEQPSEPPFRPTPDDLAYVIYTSGTTGKPKGVEVTHGGLANVLSSLAQEPGLGRGDSLMAVTTFAFDIAGVELFLPLTVGGSVVLVPSSVAEHGKRLLASLNANRPSVMQATPATWQMLLEAGWSPETDHSALRIWCGGEALPKPLADALLARSEEVWNLYGPTETTIWSACWKVEPEDPTVPIGRPLANTDVFILDATGRPAPVGVPGELLIGGAGLARGYRNLPDQTSDRFLSQETEAGDQHRLYRTGDLARWTARGSLEYLGRMDFQVKIRGHRIELGEIESVLLEHESIQAAAASVWENRIVAYLVFDEGHKETASDIRRFLRGHLPEYMIPGFVVPLPELPMTENRKIDRKALPSPHAGNGALRSSTFEPPQGEQEIALAAIWKGLLGEDTKVGAHDNFFELGGHSLLALQAVYQMEQLKGKPVDPRAIFFETLRQLAAR